MHLPLLAAALLAAAPTPLAARTNADWPAEWTRVDAQDGSAAGPEALDGTRDDANAFLAAEMPGVDWAALPRLNLTFSSGPGSTTVVVDGDASTFSSEDPFATAVPWVLWPTRLGVCTLLCVDPDAPTRANAAGDMVGRNAPFLHWLLSGAVGSSDSDEADDVVPYLEPASVPGTGRHRIVFVLYRHVGAGALNVTEAVRDRRARGRFDLAEFARENPSLRPVAVNFFYHESVREGDTTLYDMG